MRHSLLPLSLLLAASASAQNTFLVPTKYAASNGNGIDWVDDIGFDPVPVGLDKAKLLEPDGPVFGRWLDAASMRQLLLVSAAGSGSDRR